MTTKQLINDIFVFIIQIISIISYFFILEILFKLLPIFKYQFLDYISITFILFWYYNQLIRFFKLLKSNLS